MYKKIALNGLLMVFAISLVFGFSSCSNNDDDEAMDTANYKITLTLNGVNDNFDYVIFSLAGTNNTSETSVWKINGETQAGQIGIGFDRSAFTGSTKTYVIESNFPLVAISAGISLINYLPGTITGSLKIEKNGNEVVNQAINLTGNSESFVKNYNL